MIPYYEYEIVHAFGYLQGKDAFIENIFTLAEGLAGILKSSIYLRTRIGNHTDVYIVTEEGKRGLISLPR